MNASNRVIRTFSADFLNSIANHSEVRPWLAGEGEIDLSGIIGDPTNFALVNGSGGFVLTLSALGIYEVHSMFLPGGNAAGFMIECQEWMFTRTACQAITSKVPKTIAPQKDWRSKGASPRYSSVKTPCWGHANMSSCPS